MSTSKWHPQKQRIVVVSNGITPYGAHFLRRLATEMADFLIRVIYSYEFSMGNWQITLPFSIDHVILGKDEHAPNKLGAASIIAGLARGRQLIRETRISRPATVMILGYGNIAHIMLIEWCHRNDIPCMVWGDSNILGDNNIGPKAWIKKLLVSHLVARCNALLPCGSLGVQYFQKYGARLQQIFMVPNEPDYSMIENVSASLTETLVAELRLDPSRHWFIYSGRLVDVKRVDLLIDSFSRVAELRPNWDLVIVGSGPMESKLRRRLPNQLQHRVTWTGFVASFQQMCALYRFADVLVLPSDFEPWALVVNEAVCAGLALVCSDMVGAAAELLRDRENGRLFRAGDMSSLVDALLDVTDEANLYSYRAASGKVLSNWRKAADPVDGFRRALAFCLRTATASKVIKKRELSD